VLETKHGFQEYLDPTTTPYYLKDWKKTYNWREDSGKELHSDEGIVGQGGIYFQLSRIHTVSFKEKTKKKGTNVLASMNCILLYT